MSVYFQHQAPESCETANLPGSSCLQPSRVTERDSVCYIIYEYTLEDELYPYFADLYEVDINLPNSNDMRPLSEPLFKFDIRKHPMCAGCVAFREKIYFFGGMFIEDTFERVTVSNNLYSLDTSSIHPGVELHLESVCEYRAGKTQPIMVAMETNDTIYILPSSHGTYDNPSIDSYNLNTKEWSFLWIPDHLKDDRIFTDAYINRDKSVPFLRGHFVEGSTIILVFIMGTYTFDIHKHELERVQTSNFKLRRSMEAVVVDGCIFGCNYDKGVIGYKLNDDGIVVEAPFTTLNPSSPPTDFLCDRNLCYLTKRKEKLLLVRNAIDNFPYNFGHDWHASPGSTVLFIFDFFDTEKVQNQEITKKQPSYSIIYSTKEKEGYLGFLKGVFIMPCINENTNTSSYISITKRIL